MEFKSFSQSVLEVENVKEENKPQCHSCMSGALANYDLLAHIMLTLTVIVATIDAQWEGMGDVGPARYEPALLPPCPTIRVTVTSKFSEIHHCKG